MASVCVEVIASVTRPHIHQIWKLSTILIEICIFVATSLIREVATMSSSV